MTIIPPSASSLQLYRHLDNPNPRRRKDSDKLGFEDKADQMKVGRMY